MNKIWIFENRCPLLVHFSLNKSRFVQSLQLRFKCTNFEKKRINLLGLFWTIFFVCSSDPLPWWWTFENQPVGSKFTNFFQMPRPSMQIIYCFFIKLLEKFLLNINKIFNLNKPEKPPSIRHCSNPSSSFWFKCTNVFVPKSNSSRDSRNRVRNSFNDFIRLGNGNEGVYKNEIKFE